VEDLLNLAEQAPATAADEAAAADDQTSGQPQRERRFIASSDLPQFVARSRDAGF
jgi:hypothetical protein